MVPWLGCWWEVWLTGTVFPLANGQDTEASLWPLFRVGQHKHEAGTALWVWILVCAVSGRTTATATATASRELRGCFEGSRHGCPLVGGKAGAVHSQPSWFEWWLGRYSGGCGGWQGSGDETERGSTLWMGRARTGLDATKCCVPRKSGGYRAVDGGQAQPLVFQGAANATGSNKQ